ncbi:hypothetical protein DYB37_011061, partial [Aphanomyces astaci]
EVLRREEAGLNLRYMNASKTALVIPVSQPIVEIFIGEMLFNPELDEDNEESEPIIKANALTLFHVQQDGSYVANIINPKLYELVLKDTSSSLLCDLPTQPALGFAAAW